MSLKQRKLLKVTCSFPALWRSRKKTKKLEYEKRWPGKTEGWFEKQDIHVENSDLFDQLNLENLSKEFNVEVTIEGDDFSVFGPEDNIRALCKQLKPYKNNLFFHNISSYGGLDVVLQDIF